MNDISIRHKSPIIPKMSTSSSLWSSRSEIYKNNDKSFEKLRRKRSEITIELRKQKKESDTDRRRHISSYDFWSDNEEESSEESIDLDALQIIDMFRTTNITEILPKYVRHLRKLTPKGLEVRSGDNKQLIQLLTSEEIINKLNNCLTSEDCSLSLLYETVALIAHLCSGETQVIELIVNSGIVPNLLALMSYDNLGVVEQSVLALTYIYNSSPDMAKMLNSKQFINLLIGLIDSETSVSPSKNVEIDNRIALIRGLSWALLVICQNRDQNSYNLSIPLIPYLVKLLKYSDSKVKVNVLKTISVTTERIDSIKEDDSSPILKMVQSVVSNDSLFPLIIQYLTSNEDEVVLNAILIIGNIVSWGESLAQVVIQAKALNSFKVLLTHPNSKVQRESAFTVSNITAGNIAQIQTVIEANLIPLIIELLYMGDFRTQVEASHVLRNISAIGSSNQIYYMLNVDNSIVNMDVIDAMVTLITSMDASVINTCLQFYNNVFFFSKRTKILKQILNRCENSSIMDHLYSLQVYKNTEIAFLASHIIDEFFNSDSSLEEDSISNTSLNTNDMQMETGFSF